MSSPSPAYPPYQPHRNSQSFDPNAPPAPPPKPSSQEVSRRSTPAGSQSLLPPPPAQQEPFGTHGGGSDDLQLAQQARMREATYAQHSQDPGEQWLPTILEDKSKQDLADVLAKPELLAALAHSSSTAHPSVAASQEPLQAALKENIALASHLNELEARLTHLRSSTQAQLLSTHALERQWRQKQSDMDRALAPFSPSSLYQRLSQGVQEQEMVCRALEESFLEGDGATASEREAVEWVRRYREAKKIYYSRQERKERWDEGRVYALGAVSPQDAISTPNGTVSDNTNPRFWALEEDGGNARHSIHQLQSRCGSCGLDSVTKQRAASQSFTPRQPSITYSTSRSRQGHAAAQFVDENGPLEVAPV